jgi:hypothetical protein
MIDFAIHPPIHIVGRDGTFIRSTAQAAAFVRERILHQPDIDATQVLGRLEKANSAADAQRAAKVFRAWIAGGGVAPNPIAVPEQHVAKF